MDVSIEIVGGATAAGQIRLRVTEGDSVLREDTFDGHSSFEQEVRVVSQRARPLLEAADADGLTTTALMLRVAVMHSWVRRQYRVEGYQTALTSIASHLADPRQGLKQVGADLQTWVRAQIKAHREEYPCATLVVKGLRGKTVAVSLKDKDGAILARQQFKWRKALRKQNNPILTALNGWLDEHIESYVDCTYLVLEMQYRLHRLAGEADQGRQMILMDAVTRPMHVEEHARHMRIGERLYELLLTT